MNKLQEKVLTLLKEIDIACKENNIEYFLGPITLKHALTQGAYVDDSINLDVLVPAEQMLPLITCLEEQNKPNRAVDSMLSYKNHLSFYAEYVDTTTTYLKLEQGTDVSCYGVKVYIMPLRGEVQGFKRSFYGVLETGWEANGFRFTKKINIKKIIAFGIIRTAMIIGKKNLAKLLFKKAMKANSLRKKETEFVEISRAKHRRREYKSMYFQAYEELEFEGYRFRIPQKAREFLNDYYGVFWENRSFDSEGESKVIILDEIGYEEYLRICKEQGLDIGKLFNLKRKNLVRGIGVLKDFKIKQKAVDIAKRSGERLRFLEEFEEKREEILDLYDKNDYETLATIFEEHQQVTLDYLKKGLGFAVNKEYLDIQCALLIEQGKAKTARRLMRRVPKEHYKSIIQENREMKTSDYIAEFLAQNRVKNCYGFQGTMIAHLVDSICNHPKLINHMCYNEQGAAFAAVGEAKATGRTAFAYATSGPGAVNLLSGIADAYYDSVPVLFITGQINTYEYQKVKGIRQHGFQEMDIINTVKPVVKYCKKVERVEDLKYILEKAWYMASEGRPGPVLIDLPMDMQRQQFNPSKMKGFDIEEEKEETVSEIAQHILEAIRNAKRPILALGNGVSKKERNTIRKVVEKLGIPVVTSMLGRDILPADAPLNFGHLGAAYGHRYANIIAHKKADLIVALGCSLCKRQTGMKPENFAKDAQIFRVDIDQVELNRKVHKNEIAYCADCNEVIRALAKEEIETVVAPEWIAVCQEIREELEAFDDTCVEREPNKVVRLISEYTRWAGVICCDVGQHQLWGSQSYYVADDQRLLFSGGHGAMGFALPAAIGAHYGTKKPVVAICGDGAFQMNIQELQWVVRENVPVTIFVMNNSSLGLIQQQQVDIFESRFYGSVAEGGYTTPDFSEIGKAYGLTSQRVSDREELKRALEVLDYTKPNLIEVMLDVESRAFPKTFFGEEMHNQRPYIPAKVMEEILNK